MKYTYSGKLNVSSRWHPLIAQAKELLEQEVARVLDKKVVFNVALTNLYENGNHMVSWHSDNETDLVEGAPIATLSLGKERVQKEKVHRSFLSHCYPFLGASRTFQLRHKSESMTGQQQTEINIRLNAGETISEDERALLRHKVGEDPELNRTLTLGHGDLFVMAGQLQKHWRHRVPQEKEVTQPRIVFTFRSVAEENVQL